MGCYREVELLSRLAFSLSLSWIGQCLVVCSLNNLFWLCSHLSIKELCILIHSDTELAFLTVITHECKGTVFVFQSTELASSGVKFPLFKWREPRGG